MQNIKGFWHMKGYCRNPAFQPASRFKQKSRLLRYLHNPLFIPTHAANLTASPPACLRFGYQPPKLCLRSPASFCGGKKLSDSDLYADKMRSDILTLMFSLTLSTRGCLHYTLGTHSTAHPDRSWQLQVKLPTSWNQRSEFKVKKKQGQACRREVSGKTGQRSKHLALVCQSTHLLCSGSDGSSCQKARLYF